MVEIESSDRRLEERAQEQRPPEGLDAARVLRENPLQEETQTLQKDGGAEHGEKIHAAHRRPGHLPRKERLRVAVDLPAGGGEEAVDEEETPRPRGAPPRLQNPQRRSRGRQAQQSGGDDPFGRAEHTVGENAPERSAGDDAGVEGKQDVPRLPRPESQGFHQKRPRPQGLQRGMGAVAHEGTPRKDPVIPAAEQASQKPHPARPPSPGLPPVGRHPEQEGEQGEQVQESDRLQGRPPAEPLDEQDQGRRGGDVAQGARGVEQAGDGRKDRRGKPAGKQLERPHEVAGHADPEKQPSGQAFTEAAGEGEKDRPGESKHRASDHHPLCADTVQPQGERNLGQGEGVKKGRRKKPQGLGVERQVGDQPGREHGVGRTVELGEEKMDGADRKDPPGAEH